jgi:hypothetical protein|tara:strand:- start:661 stop:837 length:177 start_codon:yes stop_codon:yes gene_type:complete
MKGPLGKVVKNDNEFTHHDNERKIRKHTNTSCPIITVAGDEHSFLMRIGEQKNYTLEN